MGYTGIEINMLNVGDADCILVSKWSEGYPTRVLIDGGRKTHSGKIKMFLSDKGISHLHHIVCTHLHDDHNEGLVEIAKDRSIRIDNAWVHMPENHVDVGAIRTTLKKTAATYSKARVILESFDTNVDLIRTLRERGIEPQEPFSDEKNTIAFFKVCGPSKEYYKSLLNQYKDIDKIKNFTTREKIELLMEKVGGEKKDDALLDDPTTTPENNSSIILLAEHISEKYLFTGDAGKEALERANKVHVLSNCKFLKIPHHGSRHNITPKLVIHYRPKIAFISAVGSKEHPHSSVVAAFRVIGTNVFSTHYEKPDAISYKFMNGQVKNLPSGRSSKPL